VTDEETRTEKRPITAEDLVRIVTLEDPRISPDGRWIAFVHVTPDRQENGYQRNIWLSPTDGGKPIQLTRGGKDSQPRWSPDSRTLAFTSVRGDHPQIYLLSVIAPGGEARALTSLPNGASDPAWSQDGKRIAFLSAMNAEEREREDRGEKEEPPRDKLDARHRKERREEDDKNRLDPYVVWRIPYRAGTSFLGDRYAQVYTIAADAGKNPEDAVPSRLTSIDANHEPPQWSPDGRYIYTSRQIDITQDEPFRQLGIYRIRVEDGEAELLSDPDFSSFAPRPSPDGKWLAYGRLPREQGRLTESNLRLAVMLTENGETHDLNLELDRAVADMGWSYDSSGIVFAAENEGDGPLYRVDVGSSQIRTLAYGKFKAMNLSVGPDGGIAFVASTPVSPTELYWLPPEDGEYRAITAFNKDFLDEVIVQPTNELRFTNSSGQEIQGWYLLPVGYQEGEKYPLALNIHGGPHFMWGPSERTMFHEWQFHAARGYVAFYCNPRGSGGYGEVFLRALHAAWGDVAFDDIMAGVDALLAKGFVDEERMAVTGGSYGGYMTAWVVGHTDRFRSAVTQRGVYNLSSFYGTSDIPSLISSEFDVVPWEDYELLWRHSPLAYAHEIKTPLLILHSENDYRVPIEQAEQLFAYVRRSGGTVELVRYPRDGHELSRSGEPEHRIDRLTRMVDWFDRYCMPDQQGNNRTE
jgi:dipeptidyl aminopeptidase/acylaminoacyl peptidase